MDRSGEAGSPVKPRPAYCAALTCSASSWKVAPPRRFCLSAARSVSDIVCVAATPYHRVTILATVRIALAWHCAHRLSRRCLRSRAPARRQSRRVVVAVERTRRGLRRMSRHVCMRASRHALSRLSISRLAHRLGIAARELSSSDGQCVDREAERPAHSARAI